MELSTYLMSVLEDRGTSLSAQERGVNPMVTANTTNKAIVSVVFVRWILIFEWVWFFLAMQVNSKTRSFSIELLQTAITSQQQDVPPDDTGMERIRGALGNWFCITTFSFSSAEETADRRQRIASAKVENLPLEVWKLDWQHAASHCQRLSLPKPSRLT